jgi:hypothetical protein
MSGVAIVEVPNADPAWVPLASGVRVLVQPAGEVELATARAWMRRAIEKIEAIAPLPEQGEAGQATRQSVSNALFVRGLARLCVQGWEGVNGEFSPGAAAVLIEMPGMTVPFLDAALRIHNARAAEGNESGLAPNGTLAAGQPIAKDAEAPA